MKDITNQIFGRLHVIVRVTNDKHGRACWLCACSCGHYVTVTSGNLISGNTKSCGCYQQQQTSVSETNNISGCRFGNLFVLQRAQNNRFGSARWVCLCICGKEVTVNAHDLMTGNTKSCGCYRKEVSRKRVLEILHRHPTFTFGVSESCRLFLDALENEFFIKIKREVWLCNKRFDGKCGRILIEIDSDYWHTHKEETDAIKDAIALQHNYIIVRMVVNSIRDIPIKLDYYRTSFRKVLLLSNAYS